MNSDSRSIIITRTDINQMPFMRVSLMLNAQEVASVTEPSANAFEVAKQVTEWMFEDTLEEKKNG